MAVLVVAIVATVAPNVAVVAPDTTVTDAGTVNIGLLLVNVTTSPPAGAAAESVTVQPDVPRLDKVVGVQVSELTTASGTRDNASVCELPL